MLSHEEIWLGIDRLAATFGYSPSGLAKQAGLDPTSFNKSKRITPQGKERWPSTESIAKVLKVTGATMSEFIALIGQDNDNNKGTVLPQYLPMMSMKEAAKKNNFDSDSAPSGKGWSDMQFPESAHRNQSDMFAIEVSDTSLEPVYREGDRLVIAPSETARRGDRVFIKPAKGAVVIGTIKRQTANVIDVAALDSKSDDTSVEKKDVAVIGRIVWASQ